MRLRALRPAGVLAGLLVALAAAGCAHLLPLSLQPLSRECPGPLAPVASLDPHLHVEASYRRIESDGGDTALRLVAERHEDELVLAALSPLGAHVFTVVQRGGEARVVEHVRPLYPHPPVDVLRDLHRAWRSGAAPGRATWIETVGCDYRALLTFDGAAGDAPTPHSPTPAGTSRRSLPVAVVGSASTMRNARGTL